MKNPTIGNENPDKSAITKGNLFDRKVIRLLSFLLTYLAAYLAYWIYTYSLDILCFDLPDCIRITILSLVLFPLGFLGLAIHFDWSSGLSADIELGLGLVIGYSIFITVMLSGVLFKKRRVFLFFYFVFLFLLLVNIAGCIVGELPIGDA